MAVLPTALQRPHPRSDATSYHRLATHDLWLRVLNSVG